MKTFSIEAALNHGWELWKQNKFVLAVTTLLSGLISNAPDHGSWIYGFVVFAISTFFQMMWWGTVLMVEEGKKPKIREVINESGHYFKNYYLKYLLSLILLIIGTIAGFVLLVVPGIYFVLRYNFVTLIILDKNLSIREAFLESSRITEDVKWKLLGLFLVALLVNIVGAALLVVGLLVTIPLTALAYVHVYKQLSAATETATAVQPVIEPQIS